MYRFLSVCAAQRLTPSTLNKNVIGHAQIDQLEAISFLFFRWLTAILVNSLSQSMFPFILCYAKAKVEENEESTPRTSFLPNCFPFYPIDLK